MKTSAQLAQSGGTFIFHGGGNLVCRIDAGACGDTANAKNLFIKTFIDHPVQWYSLKFAVIGAYWFTSLKDFGEINNKPTTVDMVMNGLLLFTLIVLVALLFSRRVRSHGPFILLMWFNAAFFSAYLLIFTLVHFEVRYFYFPKIAGIFMALIVVCQYFRPTERTDTTSEGGAR